MPKNRKVVGKIFHPIQKYGLNAILGFGLGVAIVYFSLTVFGKPGTTSIETRRGERGDISERANSINLESQEKKQDQGQQGSEQEKLLRNESDSTGLALKDRFTVLLVGVDNRPEEGYISNTDSLIVASLGQKTKKMILLSIPRDTQVILPNKTKEKINALARLGKGVPSTKQYVEELIGNPIEGYVLTSFQGFKNIIDSLGGITVNVEKNMYYDTGDNQDRYINLKKGTQKLNGTQALQYARFRNDELADISRAGRQQEIIKAIVAEATEPRNLPKLPFLIPKVYQSIQTDLNISQLWSLALALKNREQYEVVNQTLPGKFSIEEGISYWKVNSKESEQILGKLFEGKKSPLFSSSNSSVTLKKPTSGDKLSNSSTLNESSKVEIDEQNNKLKAAEIEKEGTDMTKKHENQGITFEVIGP